MAFLEKIAAGLMAQYGAELHRLVFVFPTRRAPLYFQRSLKAVKPPEQTIWSPSMFSIDDFFAKLARVTVSDQVDLILELYSVYNKRVRHYSREFSDFYPWGKMILSDFDEMDKYLLDTKKLFKTLKEFKAIEDFDKEEKSEIYTRYTGFWEDLGVLYNDFNRLLKENNKAYEGMIYRKVAENVEEVTRASMSLHGWEKVVFCGFNALTPAEETLLRYLRDNDKAEIFWDMDHYFVDDENQEAGHFFRKNRAALNIEDASFVEYGLLETRNINIIGVPTGVSQSKVLGIKLQELIKGDDEPDNIAVVLPDESLLFPTLNSLPDNVNKINVTIGFPLQQTPVFSLLDSIMEMQIRNQKSAEGFYHKDIRRILNHPYIKPFADDDIDAFMNEIKESNLIYIKDIKTVRFREKDEKDKNKKEKTLSLDIVDLLFGVYDDSGEFVDVFLKILDVIREFFTEDKPDLSSLDYEYIYHFYTFLRRLKEILNTGKMVLNLHTFRQMLSDIVKANRVPFTGEPLVGLQIMGVLETQTLDFNHVYILSVNEGHLPPGKSQQSFIPYDIRVVMGLPTYKDRDAIAAYHFYRLLKNSRNVTLFYVTESRGIDKNEKSRFIDQLLIEYSERNRNARINHYVVDFTFDTGQKREIEIRKSEKMIAEMVQEPHSASSLLTYLTCPLKYYFSYGLKLREDEDVFESPDYKQFGTILHNTLKELYLPLQKKESFVTNHDINAILPVIETCLKEEYGKVIKTGDIKSGRNYITYEVMKKFLYGFFEKEKQRGGFKVELLEKRFEDIPFLFESNGIKYEVKLKGFLDRLDTTPDGNYCIIDYKTGKTGSLKIENIDALIEILSGEKAIKQKEVFQLLFYLYLLQKKGGYKKPFRLGIYSFKRLYDELAFVQVEKSDIIKEDVINSMEEVLEKIFVELFNMDIGFHQTKNIEICRVCQYANICNKEKKSFI